MSADSTFGFKHSGQLGDIVYSLPFIKSFLDSKNAEHALLLIPSDKKSNHAKGLKHIDDHLMINQSMFDFVFPLLKHLNFVSDAIYLPEKLIPRNVVDLDFIRNGDINLSSGNIKGYYYKAFGLIDNCASAWLNDIRPAPHSYDLVIGRSTRYLNTSIDYQNLELFNLDIGFIGTHHEYKYFRECFPNLRIDRIILKSALDAAEYIKSSKLYIGNQSLFFAIAESLNHPRLLEVFEPVPNVIPLPGVSGAFTNNTNFFKLVCNFFNPVELREIIDRPASYILSPT